MQSLARIDLEAHTPQHMTIAAPYVDCFNAKTLSRGIHEAAILAKSTT
jgi:hypothetical protein